MDFDNILEITKKVKGPSTIAESRLTRVWQMAKRPDEVFAIISAFRHENTPEVNQQQTEDLKSDIRNAGFGYWPVEGHWIEDLGKADAIPVIEDSFFVSAPNNMEDREQKLWDFTMQAGKDYFQEGVTIKVAGDEKPYKIIDPTTGDVVDYGGGDGPLEFAEFHPDKIAKSLSKLRDGHTFTFDNIPSPKPRSVMEGYKLKGAFCSRNTGISGLFTPMLEE